MGLRFRTRGVAVLLVVEVAHGEERKPSSLVGAFSMGKHKGGRELAAILAGDHVHHPGRVFDRVIPKGAWHLFFSEVGTEHVDHYFPMGFDQPVRRLTTGRAGHDGRVVVVEEGAYSAAKQLLIAVTSELTGESAGLISKGEKCGLNVIVLEGFKAKRPVVADGTVDEDEGEFVPTDRDAVSKSNINMDDVVIFGREPINRLAVGCFQDCHICAEGEGKLAGVEQDAAFCAGNNMLIVAKAATAGESMEFLRCMCSLGLRSIRRVTRPDRREMRVWVVEGGNNLLIGHAFQFDQGAALGREVVAVDGTMGVLDRVEVGGPVLKLAKIKFTPNAIFRVVSCLYILYDLTYSFLWKNSNHSLSYKVYRCFTVFFTSD